MFLRAAVLQPRIRFGTAIIRQFWLCAVGQRSAAGEERLRYRRLQPQQRKYPLIFAVGTKDVNRSNGFTKSTMAAYERRVDDTESDPTGNQVYWR
jgi:hypothetical protein